MNVKVYFLIAFSLLIIINTNAQERIFVDFGSTHEDLASQGYINNISSSYQSGYSNGVLLFNNLGTATGINLKVHDAWLGINTNGTTAPHYSLGITNQASQDNFYGATGSFNSTTESTGGFKLRKLDVDKNYSFSFFGSRMDITKNLETVYTVAGKTTLSTALNTANNSTKTALIYNVKPDSNGIITVTVTAGKNNNSDEGFYYLNAMEIQVATQPITEFKKQSYLELIYPNRSAVWETGKTVSLLWKSEKVDDITILYSTDGGNHFEEITTVPATDSLYHFTVPDQLTKNATIRIVNGSQVINSPPITIIPNEGTVYRIVVLGSSTSAGSGPSNLYNAWVWKYRRFLKQLDTRYEVVNLSQGGFVTYNILPTGTDIPSRLRQAIDLDKNITKAIDIKANGIIINLPSNDAASNFSVDDQVNNYNLMAQTAAAHNIPLWVTTPQPRNFKNKHKQVEIQSQMINETYNLFKNNTIDFWTGLGNVTGNGILLPYDSGDGIHVTNEAHQFFYDQVVSKNIHNTVKRAVDESLTKMLKQEIAIAIYPEPVGDFLFIATTLKISQIEIYNDVGQVLISVNTPLQMVNVKSLESGFYIIKIKIKSHTYQFHLVKK